MITRDSYQEFLGPLQKRGSKPHHIGKCLGSRDAWKWVRRNRWRPVGGRQCDQSLYSAVIDSVNRILAERLLEGHRIELPHQMGTLCMLCVPARVAMDGGEITTNYRTDWERTLRLWYEDSEARNSHRRVKRVQRNIYFIRYYKAGVRYVNKRFYMFRANRSLVRKMGKAIENGTVCAEHIN